MTVNVYMTATAGLPNVLRTPYSMIDLLRACLVTGYSMGAVASLTATAGVATLTMAQAHGYIDTRHRITIAGATQPEYNGTFSATVLGTHAFQFPIAGAPASLATGVITAHRPPAGWTVELDPGDGRTLFRNSPVTGSGSFYRVRDDGLMRTDYAVPQHGFYAVTGALGYVSMDELITPFPRTITGANRHHNTMYGADREKGRGNGPYPVMIIADAATCYVIYPNAPHLPWGANAQICFVEVMGDVGLLANIITHPRSIVTGAGFGFSLQGESVYRSLYFPSQNRTTMGKHLSHPITGGGESTNFTILPQVSTSSFGGRGGFVTLGDAQVYPSPITGGAVFERIYISDDTNNIVRTVRHLHYEMERFAYIPGMVICAHTLQDVLGRIGDPMDIVRSGGVDYLLLRVVGESSSGPVLTITSAAFDLTGPWRV